jgi:hypothetical protein
MLAFRGWLVSNGQGIVAESPGSSQTEESFFTGNSGQCLLFCFQVKDK